MRVTGLLLLCLCCAALTECQRRRIKQLPRLNFQVNFNQYSGYLTSTDGRRLFYWLVESSEVAPAEAPLVLWLNGGPGCSSIGGLLMTNGPFLANDRAELDRNELAWNRLANMLYIDSPNGVGLSEPGPVTREVLNDEFTTRLNLVALQHFFGLFPEYSGRPFYITGESYAGTYIPLLAHAIQQSSHYPALINLKGIAVANGLYVPMDAEFDDLETEFLDIMGLSVGNFSLWSWGYNPYNVAKPCFDRKKKNVYRCINSTGLVTYLNDKEVRSALGTNETVSTEYVICNNYGINQFYAKTKTDVLFELTSLAGANISVLLYHGTLDTVIPLKATLNLLQRLPHSATQNATNTELPWFYCFRESGRASVQTGGLQKSYMNGRIRFRTVIGAGHSVPTDRPDMGLQIFSDFLRPRNSHQQINCPPDPMPGVAPCGSGVTSRGSCSALGTFYGVLPLLLLLLQEN